MGLADRACAISRYSSDSKTRALAVKEIIAHFAPVLYFVLSHGYVGKAAWACSVVGLWTGLKKTRAFYKKNPLGYFNKTRVLLGFMGFLGFSKRKKIQKVLYGDLKMVFLL